MISNEHSSFSDHKVYSAQKSHCSKPNVAEQTLTVQEIQIDRKMFTFMLKENARGRFVRIVEIAGQRRNSIVIPAVGLDDFGRVFRETVKANGELARKES